MKIEYPKWLYHASAPACIVNDAQEHALLPSGWFESPGEAAAGKANDPAAAPVVPTAAVQQSAPPPPPASTDPSAEALAIMEAEKAELYETPVAKIVDKLAGSSKATLERVAAYEAANPKGPRASLVKALAAALASAQ